MNFPEILFVSNRNDLTVDYLISLRLQYPESYVRINSEDITTIDFSIGLPQNVVLRFENDLYDLSRLKSAYFRRSPSIFPESIDKLDQEINDRERRAFFEGMYLSLNCNWVNPIFSTYKSERKLYQLNMAQKVGFEIPRTIVSNSPKTTFEFVQQVGECIIKPISFGVQNRGADFFSIYTSAIQLEDFPFDKESLFEAPIFIQERIANRNDIRVTVIGQTIFAVEIEKENKGEVDWRRPSNIKHYKEISLPSTLVKKIQLLHRKLDLVYSAFDFIKRPDGTFVFLETNPAGEWVWLDRILDGRISDALIKYLAK